MKVTVREARTRLSRLLRRGQRQIWGDLEGSIGLEFDELPDELAPYT